MKNRSLRIFASILTYSLLAATIPSTFSEPETTGIPHYAFLSGELATEVRNALHTIAGSSGKKLLLEDTRSHLPFTTKNSFMFTPFVALSDDYAEVGEVRLDFGSTATTRREAQVISDNQAIQDASDFEVAKIEAEVAVATSEEAAFNLQNQADEITLATENTINQTQAMINEGGFESEGIYDIFYVQFSVTAHQDIRNAYAALVMSYNETDPLLSRQDIKKTIVRVTSIGDLQAGEIKFIKTSKPFIEQPIEGATMDVYVYSGDGTPIATNQSKGLKQLTNEQLIRWKELEAKHQNLVP